MRVGARLQSTKEVTCDGSSQPVSRGFQAVQPGAVE
jgi:hypothetical protein